jgi:uncharacterized protein (TIGR02594 family)
MEKPSATSAKIYGADYNGPLPNVNTLGTQRPTREEQRTAQQILRNAPTSSPIAIMRYFAGIDTVNKDGEAFNAGWHKRWNPVIVEFFAATNDQDSGNDLTPWCAAFMNWTLARCGFRGGTNSSKSGSFRKSPGIVSRPSVGDMIVFVRNGDACAGHVALYVGRSSDSLRILGGNQTDVQGHSSVNEKKIAFNDQHLKVHSYHRIDALRPRLTIRPDCR